MKLYKFILTASLVVAISNLYAQTEPISLGQPIPFDVPFSIKITDISDKVESVSIACVKGTHIAFNRKTLEFIAIDEFKQDTKGNVIINVPPVPPSSSIYISLEKRKLFENIEKVNELLLIGSDSTAKIFYDKDTILHEAIYYDLNLFNRDTVFYFKPSKFEDYKKVFDSTYKDLLVKKNDASKEYKKYVQDSIHLIDKTDIKYSDTELTELVKALLACVTCRDTVYSFQLFPINDTLLFEELMNLDKLNIPNILLGKYPNINSENQKESETLPDRIKNIEQNLLFIEKVKGLIKFFHHKYNVTIQDHLAYLNTVKNTLEFNFKMLKKQKTKLDENNEVANKYQSELEKYYGFRIPIKISSGLSYTYNFSTRSSYLIQPDFGFIAYNDPINFKSFWGFTPILGFHVNFRPYNTEIPFAVIRNKSFVGRFSFESGLTVLSIEEKGIREGLVGNSGLYTGFGFIFGHGARFNIGSMWFKKVDPNPLIDHKTPAAILYFGLSLDMRLKEIYNSFAKIYK